MIDFIKSLPVIVFLLSLNAFPQEIDKKQNDYLLLKVEVRKNLHNFKERFNNSDSIDEQNNIISESRKYIFDILTINIFPAWYDTKWGFYGNTHKPGKGEIACGTFIVYTLQDVGFNIPSKMANQPSENIIKNICIKKNIKRFSNHTRMEKIANWIRTKGEGIYIVGLDIHIGFIIYKKNRITFCHSSYYNPPLKVVNQDVMEQSPLTDSRYRVIGKILDDKMIEKWINKKIFPLTYDYYR